MLLKCRLHYWEFRLRMNEHNIHGMMNVIVSLLKSIIESKHIWKLIKKRALETIFLMIGGGMALCPLDPPLWTNSYSKLNYDNRIWGLEDDQYQILIANYSTKRCALMVKSYICDHVKLHVERSNRFNNITLWTDLIIKDNTRLHITRMQGENWTIQTEYHNVY